MKKLIFVCTSLLLMAACSQKSATGYTITGTAEGTEDGDTVFICSMEGFFSMIPQDTTIVKNGQFVFKGETEGASLRYIVPIHQGEATNTTMFILENADIKVTLTADSKNDKIEGGPNQRLFEEFEAGDKEWQEKTDKPWKITLDSTATEDAKKIAQKQVDSLTELQKQYHKDFIIKHVPSALSDMLFAYYMKDFTDEEQENILKLFGEKQPQFPVYKSIMAERAAEAATAIGSKFTDFTMSGTDGKEMKVSDFVGKNDFLLVDFWASWCGPCRAEMPFVIKAYNAFHQKGFEVLGVSLDNDKEAWLKAIDQLKLPWPHMSDLKGWECEGAKLYNVRGIPANILIDKDGKIIAKNLRGEDLYNKLAELIK